jgi:hypothetical protein
MESNCGTRTSVTSLRKKTGLVSWIHCSKGGVSPNAALLLRLNHTGCREWFEARQNHAWERQISEVSDSWEILPIEVMWMENPSGIRAACCSSLQAPRTTLKLKNRKQTLKSAVLQCTTTCHSEDQAYQFSAGVYWYSGS